MYFLKAIMLVSRSFMSLLFPNSFSSLRICSPVSCCRIFGHLRARWWSWRAGSVGARHCRSGGTVRERRSWTPPIFGFSRKVRYPSQQHLFNIIGQWIQVYNHSMFLFFFGILIYLNESEPRSAAESGTELSLLHLSSFLTAVSNIINQIISQTQIHDFIIGCRLFPIFSTCLRPPLSHPQISL